MACSGSMSSATIRDPPKITGSRRARKRTWRRTRSIGYRPDSEAADRLVWRRSEISATARGPMADFVIAPPPQASVPVAGGGASRCGGSSASGATTPSPCPRDGRQSGARGALLLHQAGRRGADGGADMPYPPATREPAPRNGTGGGHRHRRGGHPGIRGFGPCVGLCRRHRHDAARHAERRQGRAPPVGHEQGVRPLRPDRRTGARRAPAGPHPRQDRAEGERRGAPDLRPVADDLERGRDGGIPVNAGPLWHPAT